VLELDAVLVSHTWYGKSTINDQPTFHTTLETRVSGSLTPRTNPLLPGRVTFCDPQYRRTNSRLSRQVLWPKNPPYLRFSRRNHVQFQTEEIRNSFVGERSSDLCSFWVTPPSSLPSVSDSPYVTPRRQTTIHQHPVVTGVFRTQGQHLFVVLH